MDTNIFSEELNGQGMKFALVVSRFNRKITEGLEKGCLSALIGRSVRQDDIAIFYVPGSFEIPLVAKKLAFSKKYNAIIAIGAVIRGDTPHFDYVAKEVADGVARAAYHSEMPVIFGVITCNTLEQAQARSANGKSNKGYEAGLSAIETVIVLNKLA